MLRKQDDGSNKKGMTILITPQNPHPVDLGHRNVKVVICIYFKARLISILAINTRSNAALPLCVSTVILRYRKLW